MIDMSNRSVSGIGFHPSDDFFLSDDLVFGTLFLQSVLWNFLLCLMIYNILLILCSKVVHEDTTTFSVSQITRQHEDSNDGLHYLITTTLCFIVTSFSLYGVISGHSLFTLAFILVIPFACIASVNNMINYETQGVQRFFGDEKIDAVAASMMILAQGTALIVTCIYVFQIFMQKYGYITTAVWPPRFDF